MIMVTAFRPFGPNRLLHGRNSSQLILNELRARAPAGHDYVELDVSAQGIKQLTETLGKSKPKGIVLMGETNFVTSGTIKLEPFAVHAKPAIVGLWDKEARVPSKFVEEQFGLSADGALGLPTSLTMLDGYYCNAAYLAALTWSKATQGAPVVFIHVPAMLLYTESEATKQIELLVPQVETVIQQMAGA
jgi:pyrrolidone-carboxylate peptidase